MGRRGGPRNFAGNGKTQVVVAFLIGIAVMLLCGRDAEAYYRYRKVVDTSTLIPGGVGNFTSFESFAYDGQNVAFVGYDNAGPVGLYLWNGSSLSVVVDKNTILPGGGGSPWYVKQVSIENGKVAFTSANSVKDGVYTT